MKRNAPDVRLLTAVVEGRTAIRNVIVALARTPDPATIERLRQVLGQAADRLTAGLKARRRA